MDEHDVAEHLQAGASGADERLRRITEDDALYVLGVAVGTAKRVALSRLEAAESLGVSVDFFDSYIAPELIFVRRGRRKLYPFGALLWWFWMLGESEIPWRYEPRDDE